MPINRIYVVRHGEREDFINPNWGATHERSFDPPLSKHGYDQAQEVSEFFSTRKLDMVFSSPLIRAIQTATPTANTHDTRLKIEYGLNELYVPQYGTGEKPALSIAKLSEMYPGVLDSEYKSMWAPIEDMETLETFLSRTRGVVDKLMEAEKAGLADGEIALFTHAATVQGLVVALLNDPGYSFRCPVCGITTLRRDTSNGGWVLESPPSAAHLSGGEEHLWSFADMKK